MDEQRRRIIEDLSGALDGELQIDPPDYPMYSSDASLYEIEPLCVAFRSIEKMSSRWPKYSSESHIPLVARGAGTSVAGQSIGSGLIVDFSRHMRRIESIDEDSVQVQPGLVRDELNRALYKYGRYFPPDPSNAAVTTIGSMLAIDAAGSRAISNRINPRPCAQSGNGDRGGDCLELDIESLDILKTPPQSLIGSGPTNQPSNAHREADERLSKRTIVSKLAKLLSDNESLIVERQPTLIRNCCGYYLRGIVTEEHLHFPRLLVGSGAR